MSLLYPDFLWALLLNIVPIFIHLFNYQKHETIYFSDITLFKNIEEKTKKRSQLKNLLVLISRMLILSSVILAFCLPYKKANKITNDQNQSKIGIYLDNSFSMSRIKNNQSLLEAAKVDLIHLVNDLPEKTQFFYTTNNLKSNKQFSINKSELIEDVIKTQYYPNRLTFQEITEIQKEQFKKQSIQSFILTDLQRNMFNLKETDISKNDRINILKYDSEQNQNLSIDSVWFTESNRKINENETLKVRITNHSENEVDFQIKLNINSGEVLNQSYNKIKALECKEVTFLFAVNSKGIKTGLITLISNEMNCIKNDDLYYFSYNLNEEYKVVNIHNGKNNSNTYLDGLFKGVEKTKYSDVDIKNGYNEYDLKADLLILNELNFLDEKLLDDILKSTNKNLLIFPDLTNYSSYLNLFNLFKINAVSLDSSNIELDFSSMDLMYFKNIFSKKNKNIDLPFFKSHIHFKMLRNYQTLISLTNGDPLLVKFKSFNKNIYLFTSNLNSKISNLKKHALFVPVMLRIKEESSKDILKQFTVDNLNFINLSTKVQQKGDVKIVNSLKQPTLSFFPNISQNKDASKVFLENQIEDVGHYFILKNDSLIDVISVNGVKNESIMDFVLEDEVNTTIKNFGLEKSLKFWSIANHKYQNIVSQDYKTTQYWKYFILLAIIFLILEMIIIKKTV